MLIGHLVLLSLCGVAWAKVTLDQDFIDEVVTRHNEIRAMHKGAKPVVANKRLSKYAQKWANELAKLGELQHRSPNKYGENLSKMSAAATGADHVNNLYTAEEQYYSDNNYYGTEPPMGDFGKYGHFTQIVWKKSKKIGVGKAGGIVVINYKPAGNFIGSFKKNVPKKK